MPAKVSIDWFAARNVALEYESKYGNCLPDRYALVAAIEAALVKVRGEAIEEVAKVMESIAVGTTPRVTAMVKFVRSLAPKQEKT